MSDAARSEDVPGEYSRALLQMKGGSLRGADLAIGDEHVGQIFEQRILMEIKARTEQYLACIRARTVEASRSRCCEQRLSFWVQGGAKAKTVAAENTAGNIVDMQKALASGQRKAAHDLPRWVMAKSAVGGRAMIALELEV